MKLYNSLTKQLELFKPSNGKNVTMYVCGITPYDTTHLGHAFTYMAFDILQRYMRFQGYTVTYVQNVTDIDDDILKRAKETNQNWQELGNFWTEKFLFDLKTLNIDLPTMYVKATESIDTIIEIVSNLQKKDFAYEVDGTVFFDVQKDNEYGKLSKYSKSEMITLSKERGANPDDPRKKNPLDFIMWQKAAGDEPFWQSPWGKGRPGWHIECSAMIYKYLYKYIDIHGGGSDLIYPHHESEIAQSENFTGEKPFVKFWMHTGAVGYQGEKMSKSLGNLVMISDLLKTYSPNTIRFLLLSHHYRKPWEYKEDMIHETNTHVEMLFANFHETKFNERQIDNKLIELFTKALQQDLNTPKALKVVEQAIIRKEIATAKKMADILGFII